jgi:heterodisulfide reductase subunit B
MFRELTIPNSLEDLVSVTGAVPVDYGEKDLCCGMGFSDTLNNRDHSRRIAERKLRSIKEAGAKVVISACPGCQITFDRNQEYIEKKIGEKFGLVHLNYSQLIALAMGADPNEVVGIQTHSNPIEPVLEEFGF